MPSGYYTIVVATLVTCTLAYKWQFNLPSTHIEQHFFRHKKLRELCRKDIQCPYKDRLDKSTCWGYEKGCNQKNSHTSCSPNYNNYQKFYRTGDFGLIVKKNKEMSNICMPVDKSKAFLKCWPDSSYCITRNLYIDFRGADVVHGERYKFDIFDGPSRFGSRCKMTGNWKYHGSNAGILFSWYQQLNLYESLEFDAFQNTQKYCDIIYEKPVIFVMLDAAINMYHHFCDFINIYLSQHTNGSFTTNNQIIIYETGNPKYSELFGEIWTAFSDNPVMQLKDFSEKRICVRDGMFSQMPRAVNGLYFNMLLHDGCTNSVLFKAFNEHLVHRLNIKQHGPLKKKIRISILDRKTKYRNIKNQNELLRHLNQNPMYEAKIVYYGYKNPPLLKQLEITYNTDIFVGMHGAGLTHALFLPDWGVLFELFDCGENRCYSDLSRLRGVKYFTWKNESSMHRVDEDKKDRKNDSKFTSYRFDVPDFLKIIAKAAKYIRHHDVYRADKRVKFSKKNVEL